MGKNISKMLGRLHCKNQCTTSKIHLIHSKFHDGSQKLSCSTSLANSVGRMSTAEQIKPLPSMSWWYESSKGSYLEGILTKLWRTIKDKMSRERYSLNGVKISQCMKLYFLIMNWCRQPHHETCTERAEPWIEAPTT